MHNVVLWETCKAQTVAIRHRQMRADKGWATGWDRMMPFWCTMQCGQKNPTMFWICWYSTKETISFCFIRPSNGVKSTTRKEKERHPEVVFCNFSTKWTTVEGVLIRKRKYSQTKQKQSFKIHTNKQKVTRAQKSYQLKTEIPYILKVPVGLGTSQKWECRCHDFNLLL